MQKIKINNNVCLISLCFAVAVITLLTHWPALSSNAFSFDDEQYLLENKLVKNPSLPAAGKFLSEVLYPSTVRGYYQPLAMISLMADYAIGARADNLTQFRITSLALHIAVTILIIIFLYKLFANPWAAAAAALIFGLHPMTVESIPWLSERKTVLAAFFALWSLILYISYARNNKKSAYILCAIFFVLALLSKPTTVPLPLLMLLLDFWPLNRLSKKAVLEKIPLLAISFASAIVTFLSQRNTAEVIMPSQQGPLYIPLIVTHNIIFYLRKFILPIDMSAFYPFPSPFTIANPLLLICVIATILLLVGLIISLRWTKAVMTGWLFFFLAVFPTLGIIGFHPVIAADRHAYLPMLGFLLPIAALLTFILRIKSRIFPAFAIIALICVGQFVGTRLYYANWRDTVSHYNYMLSRCPDYSTLHNNLAIALTDLGRADEAIAHYITSLKIEEDSHEVHNNLGNALLNKGQIDEAIKHFNRAIELTDHRALHRNSLPGFAEAHYNLGNALKMKNQFQQAIVHFKRALQLTPEDADTHQNLGVALAGLGKYEDAIKCYNKSIELNPDNVIAHGQLGLALAAVNKIDGAIKEFRFVLSQRPDDVEMHCNLGILLQQQGKLEEAIAQFRQALRFSPEDARAAGCLKAAMQSKSDNAKAK